MVERIDLAEITNRQTWSDTIEIVDQDTGEAIDVGSARIVFAVTDPRNGRVVLIASTGNGKIVVTGPGVSRWTFSSGEVRQLCAGQIYEIGCAMAFNGDDVPLFTGTVPVTDGGVP